MDADYDPTQQRVKMKKKKKRKNKDTSDKNVVQEELTSRKRRRSKFAEALEKPKPQFDASLCSLLLLFHASSLKLYFFAFILYDSLFLSLVFAMQNICSLFSFHAVHIQQHTHTHTMHFTASGVLG